LRENTVEYLSSLGKIKFNYSFGESISLVLNKWVGPKDISNILANFSKKAAISGDIYARFIS